VGVKTITGQKPDMDFTKKFLSSMKRIKNNSERTILILCLTSGFLLRLYGSTTVPRVLDEEEILRSVPSFSGATSMPAGSELTHNPPLVQYLLQWSLSAGGENTLAMRFPGVLFGTLTLGVLYLLVKKHVNTPTAQWALFFAAFSQFFIGFSRLLKPDGILLFFIVCILFFAGQARISRGKFYLWGAGFSMGLGLLVKLNIITLWPIILYYLFIDPANPKRFSMNDFLILHILIFLCVSPYVLWNVQHAWVDYSVKSSRAEFFSISLVPAALFLGEIFVFNLPEFASDYIFKICSIEYPFFNWVLGLICLGGAVYFLFRNTKNNLLNLLIWIFYSNFLFFSLVRPRTGGGYHFHLDNFWWAIVLVLPGLILGSAMLAEFLERFPRARYGVPFLIFYFILNAFSFISFPANGWVPNPGLKVRALCLTEQQYRQDGDILMAQKVRRYLLEHFPEESHCRDQKI